MFEHIGLQALYTAAQSRELDRYAMAHFEVTAAELMSRAAQAAWQSLLSKWPQVKSLQVLCGTGNNGGDGYLLAALAQQQGYSVKVLELGQLQRMQSDALAARQQALAAGVPMVAYSAEEFAALDPHDAVRVDAMLGTGLGGEPRLAYRAAIEALNSSAIPVMALDLPSGLCADSGSVLGVAVQAAHTVTFIAAKRGLYTASGPDYCGSVELASLGVGAALSSHLPATCLRLQLEALLPALAPRPATAHKGLYGRVLVIGGDYGMGGATALAAEAALRCGAGLVSAATRAEHVSAVLARSPEVMAQAVASGQDLSALIPSATVLVIGPGLGRSPWSEQLCQAALRSELPMVVDADALNLLAAGLGGQFKARDNWVLTPHPGEAARLLGCSTAELQADRFAAVSELQRRWGGVVLLKGSGTLISGGGQILLSDYGNPGMASGGMGDVLSGVIAALLAQGLPAVMAAALAACLHGAAADRAAAAGQRGLAASDLMHEMRGLLQ
ncbi:NAD(P)H-hydrate dehydratase [Parahaliea sp. F7430]|uniref:Bifunctional NAD(P)H-hydrate repair enzyme n=1 Tax=Sediminihaliea albiluteola TaxID=2758564 RepID=A0A7W2TTD6_9GAMM|nr:NAD(P)H-hydrate dehydratase [Sediminihaliea albiluteola]MBA6411627.1 NAD(P)H-hydrate dehydratase [Sediminihaliea albiluteola]